MEQPWLVVAVLEAVGLIVLGGTILWQGRAHEKAVQGIYERNDRYVADIRKSHEREVHFLSTMRKEGFVFQPQDEGFEPYANTPEMEADIEEQRNRGMSDGYDGT